VSESTSLRCQCGTDLAPGLLACPSCQRLVHAEALGHLTREASALESAGDIRGSLSKLRTALVMLPANTRQHAILHERASRLSDAIDDGMGGDETGTAATPSSMTSGEGQPGLAPPESAEKAKNPNPLMKAGAAAGGLGLIFWKFKFVLVFLATKAKLLLVGLSKTTTLLSMLLSLGLYWSLWGWRFALGLVLSIYVHEMGHVAALRRFGIPASAPMFLPGFGAVVRMDAYPQTAREDARIGLAGPLWGLGCAVFVAAAYYATGIPMLAAIASVGAWINLFNLVPIWQLDGGRGFRALSRPGRWGILAVVALCGVAFEEGLYVLIGLGGLLRTVSKDAPAENDTRSASEFAVLLITLGFLTKIVVPT
jgi:Zn-dependent protease